MSYPVYSVFSVKLVEDSTGASRLEMAGNMRINWGSFLQKKNLLDCLDFGDELEVMDANTPNIIELAIPPPPEP
jgi:hypothetical protein